MNGTPLYVARAKVNGVDSIGKVREHPILSIMLKYDNESIEKVNTTHNSCYLPYGGKEHKVKRYEVLVHVPPTSSPPRAEAQPASGLSGWGLLGLAAGVVAVGAAAAVVSSLNSDDESDSDSSSDSDNAVDPTTAAAVDKEDADLAEAIRQSLLLQPRPPSSPSSAASTPSHGSASATSSAAGASASAAPRAASSSSSSLPAPECIVCWNSLNPPQRIHHCVNGHFVCDDCR